MEKKLNVCLMNDSFPPIIDGVSNAILNYARIINRDYGQSFVVVPSQPDVEDNYPFEVIRYKSFGSKAVEPYRVGYPFSGSPARLLFDKNIDIIHSHCPIASGMLARSLKKDLKVPLITTYHTKFDVDFKKVLKSEFIYNRAINAVVSNIMASDDVWVVSKSAGENLRSIGYEGDYIVMPNGVDFKKGRAKESLIRDVKNRYDLKDDCLNLLFVGRVMWYKGFNITLDMLSLCKKNGIKVKLIVVGSGTDLEEIKGYAQQLGLMGEYCEFTGVVSDREELGAYYGASDLFIFPSTFDTNGLVVGEAAACSLPSVVIRDSGASEAVTDGENGFTCSENPVSLYKVICKLASQKASLAQIGNNALKTIYVSWDDSVQRAVERYHYILEKHKMGQLPKKSARYNSVYSMVAACQKSAKRTDGSPSRPRKAKSVTPSHNRKK